MTDRVEVRIAEPADAPAWDGFVTSAADACSYHRWAWCTFLSENLRLRCIRLIALRRDTSVCGVLPLVVQTDLGGRRLIVSLPYLNYAGPLASDGEALAALLEVATRTVATEGAGYAELRCLPGTRMALPSSERKVRPVLELPRDPDELWRAFPTKLRTKVRRPSKENVSVASGTADLLDGFYRVLAIKWREHGSPIYRKEFFRQILRRFPDENAVFLARQGTRPVAAAWLHGYRDTVEAIWSGTLAAFDRFNVGMLLYWTAMEWAIRHGYRVFDFGRSTQGSGTHAFKMQWGSVAAPLPWYYVPGRLRVPPPPPVESVPARMFQRVWSRLPLVLTTTLGQAVARHIPL